MSNLPIIAVLSAHRHPRLRYTLQELKRDVGWQFRLMTDPEKWAALPAAGKIAYGVSGSETPHLRLPAHSFLQGSAPAATDLDVIERNGLSWFFAAEAGYDLLAMIFFALSRYEEYQPYPPDSHQRFPVSASHAKRNNYLHRPVVREWAANIVAQLQLQFPALPAVKYAPFVFKPSYDIDLLWAWKHRGPRGFAAGIRDFLTGQVKRGWQRFTAPENQDPYLTIPFLEALHSTHKLAPIWFWLLAKQYHREDPNPFPIPQQQRLLIQQLAAKHQVGIHPSYSSSDQTDLIRIETERLAEITGRAVRHSRQHFLRFKLPGTFRALRLAGITHDYSMGYAADIGWRAGTNLPFNWYDLEHEEATHLLVHPFAAMDATLKSYLKLSPTAAKKQVLKLAKSAAPFGGDFMLLWHNSSFAEAYGWHGWQEMYEALVRELADMSEV